MLPEGYRVTLEHQGSHWWYESRRDLFLRQVRRAARALGHPRRRLSLLDYGCASGFDLQFLAAFGAAEGADLTEPARRRDTRPTGPRRPARLAETARQVRRRDLPRRARTPGRRRRRAAHDGIAAGAGRPAGRDGAGLRLALERRGRHQRSTAAATRVRDWWRLARAAGLEVLYASYFNLSVLPAMTAVVWKRRLLDPDWRAAEQPHAPARPG